MSFFIYAVQHPTFAESGYSKFGITDNFENRLSGYNTATPTDFNVVCKFGDINYTKEQAELSEDLAKHALKHFIVSGRNEHVKSVSNNHLELLLKACYGIATCKHVGDGGVKEGALLSEPSLHHHIKQYVHMLHGFLAINVQDDLDKVAELASYLAPKDINEIVSVLKSDNPYSVLMPIGALADK